MNEPAGKTFDDDDSGHLWLSFLSEASAIVASWSTMTVGLACARNCGDRDASNPNASKAKAFSRGRKPFVVPPDSVYRRMVGI